MLYRDSNQPPSASLSILRSQFAHRIDLSCNNDGDNDGDDVGDYDDEIMMKYAPTWGIQFPLFNFETVYENDVDDV